MGNWTKQAKTALSQRNFIQAGDFFKLDGDYRSAIKAYVNGKNFTEAARIYEGMGQMAKAEKLLLKQGSAKDIADFHIRNNNHDKAVSIYMNHQMDYDAAELLEKMNQLSQAARLYEKLGFHEKAGILYGKTKNFDKAIEMIDMVVKSLEEGSVPLVKTKILKYKSWIANFHIGAKRFDRAGEIFLANQQSEKAAKCYLKAGTPLKAAKIFLDLEQIEIAERILSRVDSVDSKVLLGEIAIKKGAFDQAVTLLKHANQPKLLSEAYEQMGEYLEAAAQQEKFGDLGKAGEMYARAGDFKKAAILFEQEGNYGEAALYYEKQQKFANAAKFYHLAKNRFKAGFCLYKINRLEDALKQLQLLDEDDAHTIPAKNIMAEIFFKQGVYSVARRLLEELTSKATMEDSTMLSFYYLARCLEEEGNLEGAKKYFERIAARNFSFADVTTRLKRLQHIKASTTGKHHSIKNGGVNPFNLKAGDIIDDRFKINGTIGKGGMGSIFSVRDLSLDRNIALKMLTHKRADFEELKGELLIARDLTHPYIIKVFDVGQWMKIGYFTMEYVQGPPLKKYIHDNNDTLDAKIQLIIKICKGLKAAHDQDVVHRDIKPQNIIIDKNINPKILDFGIARKVTSQQNKAISGSPKYMAPEQIRNIATDLRTDIYALGIIMFYMFTIKEPFLGKTPQEVMRMHLDRALPNPMSINPVLPYWLCDIIEKCCQKKPELRFNDMGELIDELNLNLMDY